MPKQVSREALIQLGEELRTENFTPSIINRLKHTNADYAHLANFFACKARSELGDPGYRLVFKMAALCYRIIELSEQSPDSVRLFLRSFDDDPLNQATEKELECAFTETARVIERARKSPKR